MSPLAEYAKLKGYNVSGSDMRLSNETKRLQKIGISISDGHNSNLATNLDYVVYSSAIPKENPEFKAAKKNKSIKLLHRSDYLNLIMQGHEAITITGTHGKTSSTAIVAHMLTELGEDPNAIIGSKLLEWNSGCRFGKGSTFVAEADESDGTFLKYTPFIAAITNIAKDHMDYFKDESHIIQSYSTYLQHIAPDGTAVIGWDNPLSRFVGQGYTKNRLAFGFMIGCDVRGRNLRASEGYLDFDAIVERDLVKCHLPCLGAVNAQNALLALSIARALDLDVKDAASALSTFKGVDRRLNILKNNSSYVLINDYAHNPEKIASAIEAVRSSWPKNKLIVVFEPHRYSRIMPLYEDFTSSFHGADKVLSLPVFAAGEKKHPKFNDEKLAEDISFNSDTTALFMKKSKNALEYLLNENILNHTILLVGAGDIQELAVSLEENLI